MMAIGYVCMRPNRKFAGLHNAYAWKSLVIDGLQLILFIVNRGIVECCYFRCTDVSDQRIKQMLNGNLILMLVGLEQSSKKEVI